MSAYRDPKKVRTKDPRGQSRDGGRGSLTRRSFLELTSAAAGASLLAACGENPHLSQSAANVTTRAVYPKNHGMHLQLSPTRNGNVFGPLSPAGPYSLAEVYLNDRQAALLLRQWADWGQEYDATAGQAEFVYDLRGGKPEGASFVVTVNDELKQETTDYTVEGNTVTFNAGLNAEDFVSIRIKDADATPPSFEEGQGGKWYMTWKSLSFPLLPEDVIKVYLYYAPEEFTASSPDGLSDFVTTRGGKNTTVAAVFVNGVQCTAGFSWRGAGRNTLHFGRLLTAGDKVFVSYSDVDTLAKGLAACTDRDVLRPRSVAAETNTPTPWNLFRSRRCQFVWPYVEVADSEDLEVITSVGALKFYHELWQDDWNCKMCVTTSKGIKIQGDVDAEGKPTTVFQQCKTREAWVNGHGVWGSHDWGMLVLSGNKHPQVENIEFRWSGLPYWSFGPFDTVNCKFNGINIMIFGPDDNYVFPHLLEDPNDFSDMQVSLFKDCVVRDSLQWYFTGSGYLVEGCDFGEFPTLASFPEQEYGEFYDCVQMMAWQDLWGNPATSSFPVIPVKTCRGCVIRNNVFDATGRLNADAFMLMSIGAGNVCSDAQIHGNTFINCGEIDLVSFYSGVMKRVSVCNNTFDRCQVALAVYAPPEEDTGGLVKVSDVRIAHNIILNTDKSLLSPALWVGETRLGMYLWNMSHSRVSQNDFRQSGVLSLAEGGDPLKSGIFMDGCDHILIAQRGLWPNNGRTEDYVTDINGSHNTIVNGAAAAKDGAVNIGRLTSSKRQKLLEQHRAAFLAKHRRNRL